jgi:diguanylate cyclase (GGDEF)-like protein
MPEPEDRGTRPRILVVDDEPTSLDLLERALSRRCDVVMADGPEAALRILHQGEEFAVAVCDYRMPAMTGIELLAEAIKVFPQTKRVIITAHADVNGIIDAVNRGQIHSFFRKPWLAEELETTVLQLARVHQLELHNGQLIADLRRVNEELRGKERLLARSLEERERALLAATNELERKSRELEVLAFRDGLTGLYNHRSFHERLREETARARRYGKPLSLIFCDIDHFKQLNDQFGHPLGDEILRRVAELLRGTDDGHDRLRESDIVARYGGEEFVVLLPETPKEGAKIKAERLCAAVRSTAFPSGRRISMSFGVAAFSDDAKNAEELLAFADHALYVAKHGGRNQVQVYGEGAARAAAPPPTLDEVEVGPPVLALESWGVSVPPRESFPTYHERIYSIVDSLMREKAIGCMYIDLSRLRRIELEYGVATHNEFLAKVGRRLSELRGEITRGSDLICRDDDGDAFVYFVSAWRPGGGEPAELEVIAQKVQESIDVALAREVFDLIHDHPRIAVGYARTLHNPMMRAERLIARLVDDAKESAQLMRRRQRQKDKDLLQELILGEGLTPVYQPIVHLSSGEIFGYEALTRGPRRSPLEAPLALFSVAEEVGLLFELDRACFRGAIRGAHGLEPIHRLFVNLLPASIYDASFIESEVTGLLEAANLTPANVVFEITERLAIENFSSFRRALAVYTSMGFGVAIDDVGTKHSNLEAVMALRPHFVKLSDVLTRGAAKSTVKREMLRSLGRISETIDAVMVAEGVETADDLAAVKDLGVRYGQGYFLARPGAPFPKLRASVKRAVRAMAAGSLGPIPSPPAAEFNEEDGELAERGTNPGRPYSDLLDGFDEENSSNITGELGEGGSQEIKPPS